MANSISAAKRARQNTRRRGRHRIRRTNARVSVRAVREVAETGDQAVIEEALQRAFSDLDRAANAGSIHKKNADRRKRRLAALHPAVVEARAAKAERNAS